MDKHKDQAEIFKVVDQYVLNMREILGKGSYGDVYSAIHQKSDQIFAVKQISLDLLFNNNEKMVTLLKNEIETMKSVKHKNIVQLIEVRKTTKNVYIMLEYCNQGSLEKYMHKKKQNTFLSEIESINIMKQIIDGFRCLYSHHIVHRDLKPANILIHNGIIKIADFGFAKFVECDMQQAQLASVVGSPIYMSPQVLNGEKYSYKCDIWSLGIIFFEMLYGKLPWKANSIYELIENIKNIELILPEEPIISEQCKVVLRKMLQKEEDKRISWDELFHNAQFAEQKLMSLKESVNIIDQKYKNDSFKRSKQLNEMYFDRNKVIINAFDVEKKDLIIEVQKGEKENFKDQANLIDPIGNVTKKEETVTKCNNIDQQQQGDYNTLFKKAQQHNKDKLLVNEISEWVLHIRNKAVFLNSITLQLFDLMEKGTLHIEQILYHRVLFVYSKYQTMTIYKIYVQLKQKQLVKYSQYSKEEWTIFCESPERKKLVQFIYNDLHLIKLFFDELIKKCKVYFEQCLQVEKVSSEEKEKISKVNQICNNDLIDKKMFREIYLKNIGEFFQILKTIFQERKNLTPNLKDVLIFIVHVKNSLNIKQLMKWSKNSHFDFNKYYEELSKSTPAQLYKNIYNQL